MPGQYRSLRGFQEGGDNPTSTTNIYTEERIPAWKQPAYEDLIGRAGQESGRAYEQYQGDRVQGFSDPEQAAMQGINQLGTSGGPWQMNQANNAMNQAYGMAQNAPGQGYGDMSGVAGLYGGQIGQAGTTANQYANQFGQGAAAFNRVGQQAGSPQSFLDADMAAYSKPYGTNVTDIAARQAIQFGKQQKSELGSQAAAGGAFGGYRHGLQEGGIDRGVRQEVSDLRTKGLQTAFDRGIRNFEGDRAAQQQGLTQQMQAMQGGLGAMGMGLGAQQFGQSFGQQGAAGMGGALMGANQLYNQGIGQLGQVAQGYGQMGQQQQDMAYDRLNRMQNVGQQQRALNQAQLDVNYQDFQQQQAWPKNQMSWMGSILGGFPGQMNTNEQTSMYQQQPGLFNSMMGSGIAGMGIYQGMQR